MILISCTGTLLKHNHVTIVSKLGVDNLLMNLGKTQNLLDFFNRWMDDGDLSK